MILAIIIFVTTIFLIITQPKGLKVGTTAITGAMVALLVGVVSFDDVFKVVDMVWDATLAFIGIIILSMVLDEIGFFEWCAIKIAKLSKANGTLMFIYSMLLGAFVSALFANDGAALILTPILLSKMRILKLNKKAIIAFLLAGGFISDSTSLPFIFSNLTNILTADFFHIGFVEYFRYMFFPFLVSTFASTLFLWLFFRKDIPKRIDLSLLKPANSVLKSKKLFYFSWFFITFLLFGYIIGDLYFIPISIFALGGAILFLFFASLFKAVNPKKIIKETPWQIVWFSIGLYVVVYGLKNAGLTDYLHHIIKDISSKSDNLAIISTGFISGFLSALMNNLPTNMIINIALEKIPNETLAFANIIGSNIGAKMTPFGSLATLLWLYVLQQKGVKISFWDYTKFSLLITPPILLTVLISLTLIR